MTTDPLDGNSLSKLAKDTTWEGLPENTVIGHIHLHVANLQRSQLFYEALYYSLIFF